MYSFLLLFLLLVGGSFTESIAADNSTVSCTDDEIYTDCLDPCVASCSIPYHRKCEWLICYEGCLCKEGFKKDRFDGACVPETTCGEYCLPYQEYRECGPACPPTCEDPNPVCEDVCNAGCFCKEGYIFDAFFELCVSKCPK